MSYTAIAEKAFYTEGKAIFSEVVMGKSTLTQIYTFAKEFTHLLQIYSRRNSAYFHLGKSLYISLPN